MSRTTYILVGICAAIAIGLADATDDLSYLAFSVAGLIAAAEGVRIFRSRGEGAGEDRLYALAMLHAGPVFVVLGVLIAAGVLPGAA